MTDTSTTGGMRARAARGAPWSGRWVAEHLGLELSTTASPLGLELDDLVGLAIRRNPRRAHLLVSRVLGKHVPTDPRIVDGSGRALGELVARVLAGPRPGDVVAAGLVLGYAETATGLGQCVSEALGAAPYLHSTRRRVPGVEPVGVFEEEHSHATTHLLLPADPALLHDSRPLVLVDDELSTGRTALNTIAALERLTHRDRYVIAALVDVRGDADRAQLVERAAQLGTRIDVVALVDGRVDLPPDIAERSAQLVAAADELTGLVPGARSDAPAQVRRVDLAWPADVPETARHGVSASDRERLRRHLPALAARLAAAVTSSVPTRTSGLRAAGDAPSTPARVLVLGTEELMSAPLQLAVALADTFDRTHPGVQVRFSTTTRSPVLAVDDPGYAIRTAVTFPAHDGASVAGDPAVAVARATARFVYNVSSSAADERFDTVVVVVDEVADTPELAAHGGLLDVLSQVTPDLVLVVLPDVAARRARQRRTGVVA